VKPNNGLNATNILPNKDFAGGMASADSTVSDGQPLDITQTRRTQEDEAMPKHDQHLRDLVCGSVRAYQAII